MGNTLVVGTSHVRGFTNLTDVTSVMCSTGKNADLSKKEREYKTLCKNIKEVIQLNKGGYDKIFVVLGNESRFGSKTGYKDKRYVKAFARKVAIKYFELARILNALVDAKLLYQEYFRHLIQRKTRLVMK